MGNQTERSAEKPEAAVRVVRPTRSLLEGCEYRNAASTDLKTLFERLRLESQDCQAWADGRKA